MYYLGIFLLFILPFQMAIPLFGLDLPLARVISIVLIVLGGAFFCVRANSVPISGKIFVPLIGFLGWIVMSLLLQLDLPGDWSRKLLFLGGIYPLVIIWAILIHQGHEYPLLKSLVLGGVGSALVALGLFFLQFWLGTDRMFQMLTEQVFPSFLGQALADRVASFPSLFVAIGGQTWLRATAFFPDPHVAAYFFGMVGFLALGLFIDTHNKCWLLAGLLLILVDLLTFSRGGYFGFLAGLAIFLGVLWQRQSLSRGWLWFLALAPFIILSLWPVLMRFFSSFLLEDISSLDRFELWQTAIQIITSSPWFGLGLGQYAEYVYPFQGMTLPYYAHNLYLDIAVEAGLGAIFFFVWLVGGAFLSSIQRGFSSGLSLGVAAGLAVYMVHSLFETPLFSTHIAIVFSLFVAFGLMRAKKSFSELQ